MCQCVCSFVCLPACLSVCLFVYFDFICLFVYLILFVCLCMWSNEAMKAMTFGDVLFMASWLLGLRGCLSWKF
jgi:hypothetical protein